MISDTVLYFISNKILLQSIHVRLRVRKKTQLSALLHSSIIFEESVLKYNSFSLGPPVQLQKI